jgi:hypothetical protein
LLTPKRGKDRQMDVTDRFFRSPIDPDFSDAKARSGNSVQSAATGGKSVVFRLLTGGLLVRIQPEEPFFSTG